MSAYLKVREADCEAGLPMADIAIPSSSSAPQVGLRSPLSPVDAGRSASDTAVARPDLPPVAAPSPTGSKSEKRRKSLLPGWLSRSTSQNDARDEEANDDDDEDEDDESKSRPHDAEELDDYATVYEHMSPDSPRKRSVRCRLFLASVIIAILVMIPGIVCFFGFPTQCYIAGVAVMQWCVYLIAMLACVWLVNGIIRTVSYFVQYRYMNNHNVVYLLSAVETSLACTVCFAVALALWASFPYWQFHAGDNFDAASTWWIQPLLISGIVTSAIVVVKSICLKLFSLRFLHKAYFARMQQSLFAEFTLLQLTAKVLRNRKRPVKWAAASNLLSSLNLGTGSSRAVKDGESFATPPPIGTASDDFETAKATSAESASQKASHDGGFLELERLSGLMSEVRLHSFSTNLKATKSGFAQEARVVGAELFKEMMRTMRPDIDPGESNACLIVDDFRPFVPKCT